MRRKKKKKIEEGTVFIYKRRLSGFLNLSLVKQK
jgi:hypothetical protein